MSALRSALAVDGDEGRWTWRAGTEAGQGLGYTNWAPGEPNNCCGGENSAHLNWQSSGEWNDHGGPGNPGQLNGYVIEYAAAERFRSLCATPAPPDAGVASCGPG